MFADTFTIELITLVAKFTNISSKIIVNPQNNLELESMIIDDEFVVISNSNEGSDIISKSSNDSIVVSKIDYFSEFDVGLVIGIIAGIAIGMSVLLIFRQKNT